MNYKKSCVIKNNVILAVLYIKKYFRFVEYFIKSLDHIVGYSGVIKKGFRQILLNFFEEFSI